MFSEFNLINIKIKLYVCQESPSAISNRELTIVDEEKAVLFFTHDKISGDWDSCVAIAASK